MYQQGAESRRRHFRLCSSQQVYQSRRANFMIIDSSTELRNHVYEYALDDLRDRSRYRTVDHRTMHRHEVPRHSALDWRGLTQACQVIRKEFRPSYLAAKSVAVSITHVLDYLNAYYPTTGASTPLSQTAQGEIIIIIVDMRDKTKLGPKRMHPAVLEKPTPKAHDLLPMLKRCMVTFNLDISFAADLTASYRGLDSYNASCARNFDVWFRAHRDEWKTAISKDLQKINFRYHAMSSMELVFKMYSTQSWVVEVIEDTKVHSEGREAYYSALGFRDTGHLAHPAVLQE
jgi:hypothetical protein